MGYVPKKKIYKLDFAGTEHDGLIVRMRGINTGQYMDLLGLKTIAEEDEDAQTQMLELMVDRLVEWNVEDDDGTPVPADMAGVRAQDLDLNLAIINAWQKAIAGVSDPLPQGSPSGEPSPVASIPMEALSPDHLSLPA